MNHLLVQALIISGICHGIALGAFLSWNPDLAFPFAVTGWCLTLLIVVWAFYSSVTNNPARSPK